MNPFEVPSSVLTAAKSSPEHTNPLKPNMSPQHFCINIDQKRLDRLQQKLALTELPDELEGAEWDLGAPLADIERLMNHWQTRFDWRAVESHLNSTLPQFTTDIEVDGYGKLNVHFVHAESKVQAAIPLLFVHGWPGSFIEVEKILPELVKGGEETPAFHVVAPSLVNFGFSEGVKKRGFTSKQHAEVCHKLMLSLGYDQYVTQGGDIGSSVTRGMALQYPTHCRATHLNMLLPNPPTLTSHPDLYFRDQQTPRTPAGHAGTARTKWFREQSFGYNLLQSTKPQTIGYSMADSPVGLLSWIYEKMHDWSDNYPWSDDEVLTWVCLYYFSRAGPAASQRIYYESTHDAEGFSSVKTREFIPDVKIGVLRLPGEIFHTPRLWCRTMGPVVREREEERGGHFAAWERPEVLLEELRGMFGRGGGAFACVQGRSGY